MHYNLENFLKQNCTNVKEMYEACCATCKRNVETNLTERVRYKYTSIQVYIYIIENYYIEDIEGALVINFQIFL